MKTIFAAAAIALAIGDGSAQASSGFNGPSLNGPSLNGTSVNGSGFNGLPYNGVGPNGKAINGATSSPTIGSADLIAIELPR
jgi:hypothetical protein